MLLPKSKIYLQLFIANKKDLTKSKQNIQDDIKIFSYVFRFSCPNCVKSFIDMLLMEIVDGL